MTESKNINTENVNSNDSYAYTPFPSLTLSQRIELNKICHTGAITNNNVSTFSDLDIIEEEQQEQEQNENKGCCLIC